METLTLLDMRREFGCDRILVRFLEQDLKFESFGNLGLKYTLTVTVSGRVDVYTQYTQPLLRKFLADRSLHRLGQ